MRVGVGTRASTSRRPDNVAWRASSSERAGRMRRCCMVPCPLKAMHSGSWSMLRELCRKGTKSCQIQGETRQNDGRRPPAVRAAATACLASPRCGQPAGTTCASPWASVITLQALPTTFGAGPAIINLAQRGRAVSPLRHFCPCSRTAPHRPAPRHAPPARRRRQSSSVWRSPPPPPLCASQWASPPSTQPARRSPAPAAA